MGKKYTVRRVLVLVSVLALFAAIPAIAAAGTSGDSVEGPGVYMDNVWITTSTGQAQYLNEGESLATYGAPNGAASVKNGCIGDDGFADVDRVHDYTFEFKETVSDFSLRMLDFGDFNPYGSTNHEVVMTAYDSSGGVVDTSVLSFTSSNDTNPGYPTGLYLSGDACDAATDNTDPGNWVFDVAAPGIAKVTLEVVAGLDPNIAFSDMDYTLDGSCVLDEVEVWEDYEVTLRAGQTIDAGTVNVSYDGTNIYVEFQTTGKWLMTETHVAVVTDVEVFPTTKKGNPIPGQFPYSMSHDPWTDHYTEVIPWTGDFPVYVAAHAALVEADMNGPFWASEVVAFDQGTRKDGAAIATERSDPNTVLNSPTDDVPNTTNFFSLGFKEHLVSTVVDLASVDEMVLGPPGGWVEVAFDGLIYNGDGVDVSIHETTFGRDRYPLEQVRVEALYDGEWEDLGLALNTVDGITYLDLPDEIPFAESLRITDETDPGLFGSNGDGFDLDAVDASVLYYGDETGWGEGDRFVDTTWGMYFEYDSDTECVWRTTVSWTVDTNPNVRTADYRWNPDGSFDQFRDAATAAATGYEHLVFQPKATFPTAVCDTGNPDYVTSQSFVYNESRYDYQGGPSAPLTDGATYWVCFYG